MSKRGFLFVAAGTFAAFAVVGALGASGPGQWRLVGSETAQGDEFGFANAIDGDTVVVGAPYADTPGVGYRVGEAYVFVRSGGAWTQQQHLLPYDQIADEQFGTSVAVSGDTLIASAIMDSRVQANAGAVYVFDRTGTNWTQTQKLSASDVGPGDQLGESLALQNGTAVAGARHRSDAGTDSGAVYVFTRSGSTWTQQQKIVAPDAAAGDQFGVCVALDGDTLVIGAPYAGPSHSGAAYVFVLSGGTWTEQQEIVQSGPNFDQAFGYHVAVSGDTVVVGAPDRDNGTVDPGAAYVFTRTNGTWSQQQRLHASDPSAHARFGRFVGVSGNAAVIASPLDDDAGENAGAVYVFTRSGSNWSQFKKIKAVDAGAGDKFGLFVAMQGTTAVAGAPLHDQPDLDAGSSYVLEGVTQTGGPGPGPGPGPVQPSDVDSFLVPQKVAVTSTALVASGFLNSAATSTDFAGAARFDVDGLDVVVPSLVRHGGALRYVGGGVVLTITPSKWGSSQAKFSLRYTGAVSGHVATDGQVALQFRGTAAQGAASLNLAAGKFALGKVRGSLVQPDLYVIKAGAKLGGAGNDSFSELLGFATDGAVPATASDLEIGFAGTDVVIPASSFVTKGAGFEFSGDANGINHVLVDYAKGTVSVTAKGVSLGTFTAGANEVPVTLGFGTDVRRVRLLMALAGTKLRY